MCKLGGGFLGGGWEGCGFPPADPACPNARHPHPTDEDLSVGTPAPGATILCGKTRLTSYGSRTTRLRHLIAAHVHKITLWQREVCFFCSGVGSWSPTHVVRWRERHGWGTRQGRPERRPAVTECANSCSGLGTFQQFKILGQEVDGSPRRDQADTEVQVLLKPPIALDDIERLRLRDGPLPVRGLVTFRC